ncbi:hypothetical protein NDU88_001464 [Pleurodeles waltl]|uniref:Uncharacterized protein n=1 Tax=Pleurodeles waltl TaxID=8319 RepID=A0AAV7LXQ5_PLEWA|nr:hypothetical protein NDU88_001464 [Pleurodeles waltl]
MTYARSALSRATVPPWIGMGEKTIISSQRVSDAVHSFADCRRVDVAEHAQNSGYQSAQVVRMRDLYRRRCMAALSPGLHRGSWAIIYCWHGNRVKFVSAALHPPDVLCTGVKAIISASMAVGCGRKSVKRRCDGVIRERLAAHLGGDVALSFC